MAATATRVSELLHEAGESSTAPMTTGRRGTRTGLFDCPSSLICSVRSEFVYMLVRLDREHTEKQPAEPWEDQYARALLEHFIGP